MSSFIPNPGGPDQFVPGQAPGVDIPPPNFYTMGAQAAKGAKDGGFFGDFWEHLLRFIPALLVAVVAAWLKLFLSIVAFLLRILNKIDEESIPGFDEAATASLEHVFGIEKVGSLGPLHAGSGGRAGVAKSIGDTVLKAIIGQPPTSDASGVVPSSKNATDYLSTVTHMAIEGWLEGFMGELIAPEHLHALMELQPLMAQTLGLGRMTRTILRPAIKVAVTDPFTYLLNETYRPTKLSEADAVRQYIRGRWTIDQLRTQLARLGYSSEYQEALINREAKFLSVTDLVWMVDRTTFTLDQAVQNLQDQGYTREMAQTLITIKQQQNAEPYARQMAAQAGAAFASRDIDEGTWQVILNKLALPDWEKQQLTLKYGLDRELTFKHLTISEIQTGIKQGILTIDDLRMEMLRLGYSLDDETNLELILLSQVTNATQATAVKADAAKQRAAAAAQKAADAAAKRAAAAAASADKGLSLTQFEQLVKDGLRSIEDYRAYLAAEKYSAGNVAALAQLLTDQIAEAKQKADAAAALRAQAAAKKLNISQLETGVLNGFITTDEYRVRLAQAGYVTNDVSILAADLQAKLDAAAAKKKALADATAKLSAKGLSLADEQRAVRLGLTTIDQFSGYLEQAGFASDAVDTLTAIMADQLAADDAARKAKAAAAATLKQRNLSLTTIEKAVLDGVHDVTWYRLQLAAQGFSTDDIDTLVSLVQLDQQKAAAVAKAKADADAARKVHPISIQTVITAVKLGVVGMDVLKREMTEDGIPSDDQQILTLTVVEEIAQAKSAAATRAAAAKKVKTPGLTLAQLEQAVMDGIKTMAEYRAVLSSQGVSASDVDTLSALLADKIITAQATATTRDRLTGQTAIGALTPAQWEQAVKKGARTLDEYDAYLTAQGYGVYDRATLEQLVTPAVKAGA